jgi:hypothetical protein
MLPHVYVHVALHVQLEPEVHWPGNASGPASIGLVPPPHAASTSAHTNHSLMNAP